MKKRVIPLILLVAMFLAQALVPICSVQAQEEVEIPYEQIFKSTRPTSPMFRYINPITTAITTHAGMYFIYEALALPQDAPISDFKGILAKSWGFVDDLTFEIKIYEIAHFRSGRPVTADDVIFSLETEMNMTIAGRIASLAKYVDELEKIDDYTVHIKLKPEYPRNKQMFRVLNEAFIVPKYRWEALLEEMGTDLMEFKNLDNDVIDGSGPYTPISQDQGTVYLKRVGDYWGEELGRCFSPEYLGMFDDGSSDITYRLLSEHARDVNAGSTEISAEWQKERSNYLGCWDIDGEPWEMHWVVGGTKIINFNYEKIPVFRELWLREALYRATDYAKIIEAACYGQSLADDLLGVNPLIWPDYHDMLTYIYEDNFDDVVTDMGATRLAYNPDKAIEILQEHCDAGSSVETGWYYNGEKIGGWEIAAIGGFKVWMTAVEVVAKCWRDIGIEAEAEPVDIPAYFSLWNNVNFDCIMNWLVSTGSPIGIELSMGYNLPLTGYNVYWVGSPLGIVDYCNGEYPPLPNIADEVQAYVEDLWQYPRGSAEFNASLKAVEELVVPLLLAVPMFYDGSCHIWNYVDYWVNWPTVDDPYEHCLSDAGYGFLWYMMQHVYPVDVNTESFILPKNTAEPGETVLASVTLDNEGEYTQRYKVIINLGPAKAGWELYEKDVLAWKIVTVPPGKTTVNLPITINELGSYVLVVDNWRIGRYDPGEPIEKTLTIRSATAGLEENIAATMDAVSRVESSVGSLSDTLDTLDDTVAELSGVVGSLSTLLYAIIALEAIVLIAVLVVVLKK